MAEVAVLCGLTFAEAADHTLSQLRCMEAAAIRVDARRQLALLHVVRVAVNGEAQHVSELRATLDTNAEIR